MSKRIANLLATLLVAASLLVGASATAYQYVSPSQCPNGASWSASNQPLPYYINENGYSGISFSQVESIMQDSFDTWGEPCCSNYSATYQGTTTEVATQTNDVVMSFEEQSWPTQLGNVNQTIAVTLISVYNNCTIAQAPIHYNGVGFDFCASGSGCTDLQAIATHEIGHNLGLGHSRTQSATMYAAYTGGTSARTLDQDDIDGVCSLYNTSCSCSSDSDCGANQVCTNSQCEEAPCGSDADCPAGQECDGSGDCVIPTCSSDADCDSDYECHNGQCLSSCIVCRDCSSQADCGANGFCADLGGGNKCITNCGDQGSCPGDSQCFQLPSPASSGQCSSTNDCDSGEQCYQTQQGNYCLTGCSSSGDCGGDQECRNEVCYDVYHLCLNPDANSEGVCPDTYTCSGGGGTSNNNNGGGGSCDGLGNPCSAGDFDQCTSDNDICLTTQDGSFCSCSCSSDADCGSNGMCVQAQDGNACVPGSNPDPCDGVTCGSGEVCEDGQCVDDGSGSNNNTGNNNTGNNNTGNNNTGNNNTGNNNTGNNNTGGDAGSGSDSGNVIVVEEESNNSGESSSTCSATGPANGTAPTGLALLALFGLGALLRRRVK
jgi:MYXO-CTERM domain-containing protein